MVGWMNGACRSEADYFKLNNDSPPRHRTKRESGHTKSRLIGMAVRKLQVIAPLPLALGNLELEDVRLLSLVALVCNAPLMLLMPLMPRGCKTVFSQFLPFQ